MTNAKKYRQILVMAVVAVGFGLLTGAVLSGSMATWDALIYKGVAITINPVLTFIMVIVNYIGDWYGYVTLCLLLLLVPKTRVKLGIPVSAGLILSAVSNTLLKTGLMIPRPDINRLIAISGYSYPSGHAMNGMMFCGLMVCLLTKNNNKKKTVLYPTLFGCWLLVLGWDRIYLGVHNFSDVLAGYLAGLFLVLIFCLVLSRQATSDNACKPESKAKEKPNCR